jgi:hypothetical protein
MPGGDPSPGINWIGARARRSRGFEKFLQVSVEGCRAQRAGNP